jgi:uncharacterized protein (DUF2267 family)
MSTNGVEAFDTTLQKTNAWLNELMEDLAWDNRHWAYLALRTGLHTLRDQLTIEEATDLGAQLPTLVRGCHSEGRMLTGKPVRERHKEEFLNHVREAFRNDKRSDPEQVIRAVFGLLSRRVSAGEISDVKQLFPAALRHVWPTPIGSAMSSFLRKGGEQL